MATDVPSKWNTPLTSEQFPSIKRGRYSHLTKTDIKHLSQIVDGRVCTSGKELDKANVDWLSMYRGRSLLLLKPKTTSEVCRILKYCHGQNLAVVPQGGNTSLAGGSVPVFDEVIISLKLMNKIISFNNLSGALVCEAGCTLQSLMDFLDKEGYSMPYRIGPKETCQIGGNMSTNCGGMHVVRYGTRHSAILGLEVVLADGSVLDLLTTMKKDNTGYHLKHLFLGAEGTLGIITKVSIECPVKSPSQHMLFLGVPSFKHVQNIFKEAKFDLGEILSAVEVFDETVMKLINKNLSLPNPLSRKTAFYMILATAGSNTRHDAEKLESFLSKLKKEGAILDGLQESRPEKMQLLWSYREKIGVALKMEGVCYKYDVTVPHVNYYDIIIEMRRMFDQERARVVGFGHFAEGGLHCNIVTSQMKSDVKDKIEKYLFQRVRNVSGSISSEVGLGIQRNNKIMYTKSREAINLMRNLKFILDPKCILNPYKVLPLNSKL